MLDAADGARSHGRWGPSRAALAGAGADIRSRDVVTVEDGIAVDVPDEAVGAAGREPG